MKHAIIYVPGLGDHRSSAQQGVIAGWQLYGVKTNVVRMQWLVHEPFEIKLNRLLKVIDSFSQRGYTVSLVGVSAGASAVVNAYAARPAIIHRVVCICGKLKNAGSIHPDTFSRNPGFAEALQQLPASITVLSSAERQRILSIRPLADGSVPPADTIIPGALEKVIPTKGHVVSIAIAITLYSLPIVRFLKG